MILLSKDKLLSSNYLLVPVKLLRTSDLDVNTIMESVSNSPILDLPGELQIDCFSALGEVDGTLVDALNMAMTNRKLYAIYKRYIISESRSVLSSQCLVS